MRKLIAAACVLGMLLTVAGGAAWAADWTNIGERILSYRTDTETITVKSDAEWKQVKIQVKSNPMDLVKMTVTFKDGTTFESPLNKFLSAGSSTKAIDLPAAKAITKVEVTYRKGSAERLATICLLAAS
jgi:hypothetical protein